MWTCVQKIWEFIKEVNGEIYIVVNEYYCAYFPSNIHNELLIVGKQIILLKASF